MKHTPEACLILIGNELLSGRTIDKNLSFIGERLNECGIRLVRAHVVPDIQSVIVDTVRECSPRYDYVFTTGGIGPTHDDITTESVAIAMQRPLMRHPKAEADLRAYYGPERINDARLKMADVPEGSTLIANPISIAPGFIIGNVHVLAGVPSICRAMMDELKPILKGGEPMQAITLDIDKAEGDIAMIVSAAQQHYPDVEIGIYPRFKETVASSHVVLRGADAAQLSACADQLISTIALQFKTKIIRSDG